MTQRQCFHRHVAATALLIQNRSHLPKALIGGANLLSSNHLQTLHADTPSTESSTRVLSQTVSNVIHSLSDEPLVKEVDDPNCVVLAERAINDYLKPEIDALKTAIERVGKAIDEEAAKGQGEDWSLMVGYVQSCREKLPGAIEEWQKD